MLIEPSHSVDGHRLDPTAEATEPFIAWLDEPSTAREFILMSSVAA